jgi:hypothetical protein
MLSGTAMTSKPLPLAERPLAPLSAAASLWDLFARAAVEERHRTLDAHHRFAADDALVIDRSASVPRADSRLVHYDPRTSDYIIASADRLRWCTRDGVTVFPETSPWDSQIRQDPPVNVHAIVEPPAADGGWARGWRGPFLYPMTEGLRGATARDLVVLSPSGLVHYLKELRLPDRAPDAGAEVRLALRVALAGDELLLTFAAANVGDRPLRVSLISFLLPLLTRGMMFNAESAWFHEGWAVGDRGLLIRSSEQGIACGIRRAADASVEHWLNLNALAYYGGIGRSAAFPAALEPETFGAPQSHAGFVAPACAHHRHRRVLMPGEDFVVSLALRAHDTVAAAEAYLAAPLTAVEVEERVAEAAEAGRALTSSTRLEVGTPFTSYYEWTKQQVSGCARIRPYFRLFHNYLLGIRDKAQAAYAAIDFDPAIARTLIFELSGEQFEDGRFPRQYSPDGHYDLRYFMDSGLWLPTLLVPHYLKSTGDFAVLFEEVGYQRLLDGNPEAKTGRVVASRKRSTVLQHLVENVEHVLRQRDAKTGLVDIRDGDWNDAIGLIRSSTMVLEQLYWALGELVALHEHLPERWRAHPAAGRLRPARYRRLRDALHETFARRCVQRDEGRLRILHGHTHEGRTVGGFRDADGVADEATVRRALGPGYRQWAEPFRARDGRTLYKLHRRCVDPDGRRTARVPQAVRDLFLVDRVSSTPLSFAILSGILRHDPEASVRAAAFEDAIVRDAAVLDSPRGWRTFSVPFNRCSRELGIGRIGDLDGAENASPYIHAGLFLGQALYQIGREREAAAFLDKTVPLDRGLHAGQNRSVQYLPNSWGIGRNNDGASMNDFHTNAASILSRVVVEHLVGLRPTYEGLVVQPSAHMPQVVRRGDGPIEYRATLRRRSIRLIHEWTSAAPVRGIWLGTRALPLGDAGPRGVRTAFIPWEQLSSRNENVLVVRDPIEEVS